MKANNELFGVKLSDSKMDVVYVSDDNTARRVRKAVAMVNPELPTKSLMKLANMVVNAAGVKLTEVVENFKMEMNMLMV